MKQRHAFSWLYIIVAVLVRVKLGSPVLFKQTRPGKIDPETGQKKIIYMYKFRSMPDEQDEKENLLPDEVRLGKFGKALRATSLDELSEAFSSGIVGTTKKKLDFTRVSLA